MVSVSYRYLLACGAAAPVFSRDTSRSFLMMYPIPQYRRTVKMRTVLPVEWFNLLAVMLVKWMGRFAKGASATADASRLNAEANAALCLA
jgi:hypothetical protein